MDWLDQLYQLHESDKVKQQELKKAVKRFVGPEPRQASDILRQCEAHKLLRRVQEALLDGKGVIDLFERSGPYERAIALVWQGPISEARSPNPEDPEDYQYIVVGASQGVLYVNGKKVPAITPEALKVALVAASKNPRRQSQKSKKK